MNQPNQEVRHQYVLPRQISWSNLIPVGMLNLLVFGLMPIFITFMPITDSTDIFDVIGVLFTKLLIFVAGWAYLAVWCHKVFWMGFTTQISSEGISQKYRKGLLEIHWEDVVDSRHDSFDYIIKSKNGQEIHINWVLFKNWRQMEAFIKSHQTTSIRSR